MVTPADVQNEKKSLKTLATECLQRLRAVWNSQPRATPSLEDRARITLQLCFIAQGLHPDRAVGETVLLDGPGDVESSYEEFAHWEDESLDELFQRSYTSLLYTGARSQAEQQLLYQHVACWILLEGDRANGEAVSRFVEQTRSRVEVYRALNDLKIVLRQPRS